MNKNHGSKFISALLAVLLIGTVAMPCIKAEAAGPDLSQPCTLTVATPDDMPELKEIDFTADVWRVAAVDASASYTLVTAFDELEFQGYTLKGTDINNYKTPGATELYKVDDLAKALYERALGHKFGEEAPSSQPGTSAEPPKTVTPDVKIAVHDGTGTADKTDAGTALLPGYYLIVPEDCSDDEYLYHFGPTLIAIPHLETTPSTVEGGADEQNWVYAVTARLKPEKEPCRGNVKIIKNLYGYNETMEGADFVFTVSARKNGALVYSNVITLHFDGGIWDGHALSKEYMIYGLPVGAEVEVKEAYTGSVYKLDSWSAEPENRLVIAADESLSDPPVLTFTFNNSPDDHTPHGSSVLNHYEMVTGAYGHAQYEDSTEEPSQKK